MNMKEYFEASELIINPDGSAFHIHIKPADLADKIILVGDPGRVALVASHFDRVEAESSNREFRSVTGSRGGCRMTVLSTGIGCDNIDIVMNELDALANIDFATRRLRPGHRTLEIVRVGTCGGLQPFTPIGTFICSEKSVGIDGLLNYYAGRDAVCDTAFEEAFKAYMQWPDRHCSPYVVNADRGLLEAIGRDDMVRGVTVSAGGFYGPQGRELRVPLADPGQNEKIESFDYRGYKITNYEMESSAVAGLAALLGHRALTVCMVIANRLAREADTSYKNSIDDLISTVVSRLCEA